MSGPPVLLLHGLATSSDRTWRDNGWIDLLADAGRTALPIDLLGHGDAPKPHDPAAYAEMETWVADQLPDEPVDAVGFSLGARTLLHMAVAAPDRFRRIVVAGVGQNLFEADEARHRMIAGAVAGEAPADNPEAGHFATLAESPDVDRDALVALLAQDRARFTVEDLGRIPNPVLVVIGDQDFAGPADQLADALPDAELRVLRGVDHFATPKDFGFIDAALEFLDAVPS